jgi:hypothetical protein
MNSQRVLMLSQQALSERLKRSERSTRSSYPFSGGWGVSRSARGLK